MINKFREWIASSLQTKIALLTTGVMVILLALFMLYDIEAQKRLLEEALFEKGTSMALSGAASVSHILEDAIASGRLTEAEVFDTNYRPIPNTDPQKYHTAYDSFTDRNLLDIYDQYLEDADVLYAAAADVNGYAPTHNSRYAKPLTGDYEADLIGNRTKRIFDDPISIRASRHTEGVLRQIYRRDTGEIAWDISAPIWVNGRHWGGFRVAFSLDRINAQAATMTWRTGLSMFLLTVLIGVAAFFIARRLTRPVQTLVAAAEQVSGGDLNVTVDVESEDELGDLASAFNQMAEQIRNLINTLEERIASRTRRLEVIAAPGERLSAILNLEELLPEVVNQVQLNFGYYHAHIYLLDQAGQNLVVTAGTGQAGSVMKEKGHSIALSAPTSLVARAARTGQVVTVDNVRETEDWLPNPLLPDTYAEMAVPITLEEGQVVGVLDVQEDEVAGLDEGDADLLRSLANQIAVAIRNARLFSQVETALAEARTAQERYLEQSWDKARISARGGQYHYVRPDAPALKETTIREVKQETLSRQRPAIIPMHGDRAPGSGLDNGEESPPILAAPVALRDRTIGVLQLYGIGADHSWSEDDLTVIEAVAEQLALTADNLRLFEDAREQASFETLVGDISEKLRQAPTLDILARTVAQELGQALGVSHSLVQVGAGVKSARDQNGKQ